MTRTGTAIAVGTFLLLLNAGAAEAQATATMRIPSKYAQPAKPGVLRQLVCRGRPGLHLVSSPDSSSARDVWVTLAYRRNPRPSGDTYEQLDPGACTWNPIGDASLPAERGQVHFSLSRQGSTWGPDPKTLTVWLSDPKHYWVFFVNDVTDTAISHGAYRDRFFAGDTRESASRTSAAAGVLRTVELRCRGGGGLGFSGGTNAGTNLVAMTLTYPVSPNPPGETGRGLSAGTCAWVDRAGVRRHSTDPCTHALGDHTIVRCFAARPFAQPRKSAACQRDDAATAVGDVARKDLDSVLGFLRHVLCLLPNVRAPPRAALRVEEIDERCADGSPGCRNTELP